MLGAVADAIDARRAEFLAALEADRAEGEDAAATLRAFAQQEARLQSALQAGNETLTGLEVRSQRALDRLDDARQALEALARDLELDAEPAMEELDLERRASLGSRLERLERRREQLGPVNPLAQMEYAEALEHVEELERQRGDLESALRELQKLIRDTDRQIRETFERTFTAAAANFEELAARLFPGGSGRLVLLTERDGPAAALLGGVAVPTGEEDASDSGGGAAENDGEHDGDPEEEHLGVEIEITPAGKSMKRLSLLSGGEKVDDRVGVPVRCVPGAPRPFYVLDEVEAALDDLNIDRFLELLGAYAERAQFIVVTHQKRTMEAADCLYGVSMEVMVSRR